MKKKLKALAIIFSLFVVGVTAASARGNFAQEIVSLFKRYVVGFSSPTYYYSNGCEAHLEVYISFDWVEGHTSNEKIEDIRLVMQCPESGPREVLARAYFVINQGTGLVDAIIPSKDVKDPEVLEIFDDSEYMGKVIEGINADILSQR